MVTVLTLPLFDQLWLMLLEHPYLVLLIVLMLEEAGLPLPLPGDLLILAAGAAVASGHLNPWLAGLCVVVAATSGSLILYLLGRRGGRPLLLRHGHHLRLTPARLSRLEGWLTTHPLTVVWSRLVPGLRIVTSLAAGLLRLGWPIFLLATSLSAVLWAALYLTLGALCGPAVLTLAHQLTLGATSLPLLALAGGLAGLLVVRQRRQRPAA